MYITHIKATTIVTCIQAILLVKYQSWLPLADAVHVSDLIAYLGLLIARGGEPYSGCVLQLKRPCHIAAIQVNNTGVSTVRTFRIHYLHYG